ncbi:MAG: putative dual-specificity RNA methyltransferase RlmN [Dehalococcoidia bacterium]|nr:putative dual-specificity RNA methyltransferase RlmN [Bacillota bacterium]
MNIHALSGKDVCWMRKKVNILALSPEQLAVLLSGLGHPAYRAEQILVWIYQKGARSFTEMTNLPKSLRQQLSEFAEIGFLETVKRQVSSDGTEKHLFSLADSQLVETVVLPYNIGYSACISTQVGCKMGCIFCVAGLPGFIRNLSAAEILAQVLQVKGEVSAQGKELKSLVLMGTGEPLDNFTAILAFLEAVRDPKRLGMSLRHLTLSTSGLVPKIRELAALKLPLTLAVSLHASNNSLRDKIMPINRKYRLEELLAACDEYTKLTGRRMTYEYTLIEGLNDGVKEARELAALLKKRNCHLNLIPFNAVPELDLRPSPQSVTQSFAAILRSSGVKVTIRRRLGADIAAACGQLSNKMSGDC